MCHQYRWKFLHLVFLPCMQISYASTSVALSNRSLYPNLFRTVPSDESLAPALATVMQYYGWRTLSILTEQETQFTEVTCIHNSNQLYKMYQCHEISSYLFSVQFFQLMDASLSAASISIENSVQFNRGNLSEAADTIFVC